MVRDFNEQAEKLIFAKRLEEARDLLERAINAMPAGWKAYRNDGDVISIAAWDEDDFLGQGGHQELPLTGPRVIWVPDSYSKAWSQLAEIADRERRFEDALSCLEKGLELEPESPTLWCEKGDLLDRMEEPEQALECYERALKRRSMFGSQAIWALRGMATQLITLGRLLEAESALQDLLKLDPDDEDAFADLFYLTEIRIAKMLSEDSKARAEDHNRSESAAGDVHQDSDTAEIPL
jgi:tetratricopeptide (TPR) repeat protein